MKPHEHILNLIKNFIVVKCRRHPKINKAQIKADWIVTPSLTEHCEEPSITWIGHATFLIQIDGINILTDPIFFKPSIFYPRLAAPGIALSQLPPIHAIIISHNHVDHMDKPSLMALKPHNPILLIPRGTSKWFTQNKFEKVIENKWSDTFSILCHSGQTITFTYLPAEHWTGRTLFDINKSDHGSWMIKHNDYSIYFAGDSSYAGHFSEIAQDFPVIQTALMPIGPIHPRYSVEHAHLDANQAVKAFIDLKAKQFIPMHWGTFHMGIETFDEPIILLKEAWNIQKEKLKEHLLSILKFGEHHTVK